MAHCKRSEGDEQTETLISMSTSTHEFSPLGD